MPRRKTLAGGDVELREKRINMGLLWPLPGHPLTVEAVAQVRCAPERFSKSVAPNAQESGQTTTSNRPAQERYLIDNAVADDSIEHLWCGICTQKVRGAGRTLTFPCHTKKNMFSCCVEAPSGLGGA